MKFLNLLAALGLATATALPSLADTNGFKTAPKEDTVLVKLANGAKMSLIVKNTEQLKTFQNYSLDSLMIMLNTYISEADKKGMKDVKGKDYTMTYRPAEETKNKRAPEKISITFKDSKDKNNASGKSGINIDVQYKDGDQETFSISGKTETKRDTVIYKTLPRGNSKYDSGFELDLGFNTFLNHENNTLDVVGLKPWGSRYVSINRYYRFRIGGENSPLNLKTGINVAFNNYMFQGSYIMKDTEAAGSHYTTLERDPRNLEKSKLATSSINLPLMAILDFKSKKPRTKETTDDGVKTITTSYRPLVKVGLGGFVGYRIGAHTKVKYNHEGDTKKDKDHGNFNMENLQYGPQVTLGFGSLDLFAKYNMNDLFKEDRGPKANVLSFGVTFFAD